MSSVTVAILAGGQGTRFWPISRKDRPKQFLSICTSGESLISATAKRATPLCGKENLFVVTNDLHSKHVAEHVPDAQIICEPIARNTAASIGFAAIHILKKDPGGVMIALPADHAVKDEDKLREVLNEAVEVAKAHDYLVTVGIQPLYPHTGYGYIRRGVQLVGNSYRVHRFYEKPNLERAEDYCEAGDYYWNSGMFVWRAEVIINSIKQYLPDLYQGLMKINDALGSPDEQQVTKEVFSGLDPISIDFGILEHANNCAVVVAKDFGWNDVGSWDAWADHFSTDSDGNLIHGEALTIDSRHCVIHSEHKLTAVVGAEDIIVIDSGDALLVCPRSKVQDVKKVVDELRSQGKDELT